MTRKLSDPPVKGREDRSLANRAKDFVAKIMSIEGFVFVSSVVLLCFGKLDVWGFVSIVALVITGRVIEKRLIGDGRDVNGANGE